MLAEDNPVNQKVAIKLLQRRGHSVALANNGREAVQLACSQEFDVVLMDVQMPEVDGLQASRQIRQHEGAGRHVPIIAMTASAMAGDREKCLAAGMDGYVAKPIDARELAATVERYGQPVASVSA